MTLNVQTTHFVGLHLEVGIGRDQEDTTELKFKKVMKNKNIQDHETSFSARWINIR